MVLVGSVVYRGWAIPIAGTVLPATERPAGRGEGLRRLRQVRAVVPRRFFVIVLADRGRYARWFFQRSVRLGWQPLLRINTGGDVAADEEGPLSAAPRVGTRAWHAGGGQGDGVSGGAPTPHVYAAGAGG